MTGVNRWVAMLVKPRPARDIRTPDLSRLHWVAGWPNPTAHRYLGGGSSECLTAPVVDAGYLGSTDELRRLGPNHVAWCALPACFPGSRCRVCGVPSGGHDECADCLTASIDADKAIERAS